MPSARSPYLLPFFPGRRPGRPTVTVATLALLFSVGLLFSQEERQQEKSFTVPVTNPATLDYLLYLPKGAKAGKASDENPPLPLVVFLHGAGERGEDLELVKKHGPPKKVEAGDDFPFLLVSPQCPKGSWWPWEPVHELIDHLEATLPVDPDRIYLTGLSMGGYGTWSHASRQPDRFAAIAPICGGGTPYLARQLKQLPTWAFHGAKDSVVPLSESERLVDILKRSGNEQVKFTVYPEANHDSWTETYDNPALYEWLLSHTRKAVPAKP